MTTDCTSLASATESVGDAWSRLRGIWLLAGSAGAAPAVQRFLNAFRRLPPVAFIYAQHYDPQHQEQLRQLTAENPLFEFELVECWHQLCASRVLLAPPGQKIKLYANGHICGTGRPWSGAHSPDINELLLMLAQARNIPRPGAILFSGMGSDGTDALEALDAAGGHIWVQDPADAICAGIPRSARETGRVQRCGSPESLARWLATLYC